MVKLLYTPLSVSAEQLARCYTKVGGVPQPDPLIDGAAAALRSAETALAGVVALQQALAADNTPPSKAAVAVSQATRRAAEAIGPSLDKARNGIRAARRDLDIQTRAPPTSAAEFALDSEIRRGLLSLKPEARIKAISAAIEDGETSIVRAGISAAGSSAMIAVEPDRIGQLREAWRRTHHADAQARLDAFDHAVKAIDAAAEGVGAFIAAAVDAEAEARAGRVEQALSASQAPRPPEPAADA
jgi:hypothetical protein